MVVVIRRLHSLSDYECNGDVTPVVQSMREGDMRLLLFASILLVAFSAVGQNQPSTRSSAQGGQASRLDHQATGHLQTNSRCFAIEIFRPNGSVRHSTCTDASLFRARNIPNLTVIPQLTRARCSDCSTVPKAQPPSQPRRP